MITHITIDYGFPKYSITPDGKIWNNKRLAFHKLNRNHRGYWQVKLCENGKYKSFLVHRLVAKYYLPDPEDGQTIVNHKDGNKMNNHVDNLEWCDAQWNTDHAMQKGNFKSKLTDEDIKIIRLVGKTKPYSETAKRFGISRMMVYRIVTYKSWKHLP